MKDTSTQITLTFLYICLQFIVYQTSELPTGMLFVPMRGSAAAHAYPERYQQQCRFTLESREPMILSGLSYPRGERMNILCITHITCVNIFQFVTLPMTDAGNITMPGCDQMYGYEQSLCEPSYPEAHQGPGGHPMHPKQWPQGRSILPCPMRGYATPICIIRIICFSIFQIRPLPPSDGWNRLLNNSPRLYSYGQNKSDSSYVDYNQGHEGRTEWAYAQPHDYPAAQTNYYMAHQTWDGPPMQTMQGFRRRPAPQNYSICINVILPIVESINLPELDPISSRMQICAIRRFENCEDDVVLYHDNLCHLCLYCKLESCSSEQCKYDTQLEYIYYICLWFPLSYHTALTDYTHIFFRRYYLGHTESYACDFNISMRNTLPIVRDHCIDKIRRFLVESPIPCALVYCRNVLVYFFGMIPNECYVYYSLQDTLITEQEKCIQVERTPILTLVWQHRGASTAIIHDLAARSLDTSKVCYLSNYTSTMYPVTSICVYICTRLNFLKFLMNYARIMKYVDDNLYSRMCQNRIDDYLYVLNVLMKQHYICTRLNFLKVLMNYARMMLCVDDNLYSRMCQNRIDNCRYVSNVLVKQHPDHRIFNMIWGILYLSKVTLYLYGVSVRLRRIMSKLIFLREGNVRFTVKVIPKCNTMDSKSYLPIRDDVLYKLYQNFILVICDTFIPTSNEPFLYSLYILLHEFCGGEITNITSTETKPINLDGENQYSHIAHPSKTQHRLLPKDAMDMRTDPEQTPIKMYVCSCMCGELYDSGGGKLHMKGRYAYVCQLSCSNFRKYPKESLWRVPPPGVGYDRLGYALFMSTLFYELVDSLYWSLGKYYCIKHTIPCRKAIKI